MTTIADFKNTWAESPIIKIGDVQPTNPVPHDLWFNTVTNQWQVFSNGAWVQIAGGAGGVAIPPKPAGDNWYMTGETAPGGDLKWGIDIDGGAY